MLSPTTERLPPIAPDRARELAGRFCDQTILVVGDVMLDRFLFGRVTRISPEAPVPVVTFDHEMQRMGGAANAAHNAASLGAAVQLIGVVGDDEDGARLSELCRAIDVRTAFIVDERPTTTKVRITTERNQQVARVDYESDRPLGEPLETQLLDAVQTAYEFTSAIVVSDYLKGVVTGRVMREIIALAGERHTPVLVDPKIPHLDSYRGATVITPNHHEAEAGTHMRVRTHADARQAARLFRERSGCGTVLMTRGDQGIWLLDGGLEGHLPAAAREVADVTGAGDTVIATFALALAAGGTAVEAAHLANYAAGIVVGKFGPATVTPTELIEVLETSAAI